MADLRSVLVVRLSSLGDVLFAVPAIQQLLASGRAERVSWLVEDRARALVDGVDGLHEVLVYPRRELRRIPGHLLALRSRSDDLVLDLQGNLKSRLQLAFLRAPRKVGFNAPLAREGSERALTERVSPPSDARHRIAANFALLAHLGIVADPRERPRLPVDAAADARAATFLDGLPGDGPSVVLHPGTSAFGELKRWSPARFAALGRQLVAAAGARLVVTGGPGEGDLVTAVLGTTAPTARAAPPGSLADLHALLARAALVVASDSFPLHLANALGTPVVGLYGPKDPAVTGPYYDRALVVRSGASCSPCTLRRCYDRVCMDTLDVHPVAEAALQLLAEVPGP